ncbi:9048_t:CDS:10, partial [Funneliformis geosporum]
KQLTSSKISNNNENLEELWGEYVDCSSSEFDYEEWLFKSRKSQEWLDKKDEAQEIHLTEPSLEGELDLGDFTDKYLRVYVYPQVDETKLTFKNLPNKGKITECIDAQKWLEENYPENGTCVRRDEKLNYSYSETKAEIDNFGKKRSEIKELDISHEHLTGNLDLTGFTNLTELNYWNNQLSNLNFLTTLPYPEKLTSLNIRGNNITSDLSLLSKLVNLKELILSHNPLSTSLSPLQSCSQLESLHVEDTNLIPDLQYLPLKTHPELMGQANRELVVNDYIKSELKTITTTPKYLTEKLKEETTLPTNYQLTNYSQFALRDGRPFKHQPQTYGQSYPTDLTKLGHNFCINQTNPQEKGQEVAKQQQYYNNASATLIAIDGEIGENQTSEGLLSKQTIFMFDDGLVDGRILATKQEHSVQLTLSQVLHAISHRKQTVPIDGLYSILGLLPYGDKVETNYKGKGHEYTLEELNTELKKIMELAMDNEDGSTNITVEDDDKPKGSKTGDIEINPNFYQFKNNDRLTIILPVTDKDTRPIVFESGDSYGDGGNDKLFLDMVNKEVIEGEKLITQYHEQLPIIQQQGKSFSLVYKYVFDYDCNRHENEPIKIEPMEQSENQLTELKQEYQTTHPEQLIAKIEQLPK